MFHDGHPTEGKPANFKGSMMVLRAATEAEVREILTNDVYGKGNVWDLEKMQIIPVSSPEPRLCWSTVEKHGMMLIYLGCYCCLDTDIVMYIFSEQVVLSKKQRSRCITC